MGDPGVGKVHDATSPRLTHVLQGGGPRSHLSLRILQGVHESWSLFLFLTGLVGLEDKSAELKRKTFVNKAAPDMMRVCSRSVDLDKNCGNSLKAVDQ